MRRLLLRWTCGRGRHKWRAVPGEPIVETADGQWRVFTECRRCGLLEGSPVGVAPLRFSARFHA